MTIKKIFYFGILAFFLWGCSAAQVVKDSGSYPDKSSATSVTSAQRILSDDDLFEAALAHLSNPEKEPSYIEAKILLEKLVEQYPKSKWAAGAKALIAGLDKISNLQNKLKQEKQKALADQAKLAREVEGLKDNTKSVEEKYAAEISRLQQENEQLKNDIQQLKRLEVQLEKREKMLR